MASLKHSYLIAYNTISTGLWFFIYITTLQDVLFYFYPQLDITNSCVYVFHNYTHYPHKALVLTQAFNAIVEISHSLLGVTKSPLPTICLQFFARLLITFNVCYLVPQSPGNFHIYSFAGLSLAWSITEIVRYPCYAFKLAGIEVPVLDWLRYSTFIVLYPLGLLCEPYVVYLTLDYTINKFQYYFCLFGLSLYIPGFFVLYSYMFKQRRKALGKGNTNKVKQQ